MLTEALVGWLVQVIGDKGLSLLAPPRDERAIRAAMQRGIESFLFQVPIEHRDAVQDGLDAAFSRRLTQPVKSSDLPAHRRLRESLIHQAAGLRDLRNTRTGRTFYDDVTLDPAWVEATLADTVIATLRFADAQTGLSALVRGLDSSEVLTILRELDDDGAFATGDLSAAMPRMLPSAPNHFTGREHEVSRITTTLTAGPGAGPARCYIHGMPGVGKTTLALHVAHALAEEFRAGQVFIELHGHTEGRSAADPFEVLGSLLLSVGLPGRALTSDLDGRSRQWRNWTSGRRLLIVLDDARDEGQVHPFLPESALSGVIVTSRRRLYTPDEAVTVALQCLDLDDSVELLSSVSGRELSASELGPASDLVTYCGMLPLALALVASRLCHHPRWSLGHLLRRLKGSIDPLAELKTGGESVDRAIRLSFAELDTEQRVVFLSLAFSPGAELDKHAAAALSGLGVDAADRALEELYLLNLLGENAAGRYRLHDLVRSFARTHAETETQAPHRKHAIRRLLDYYSTSAAAAQETLRGGHPGDGPRSKLEAHPTFSCADDARDWLRTELENLIDCVEFGESAGWSLEVVDLTLITGRFLHEEGAWNRAAGVLQVALRASERLDDLVREAGALRELGMTLRHLSRFGDAIEALSRAARHSARSGDIGGEAFALNYLGATRFAIGQYQNSAQDLRRSADLYFRSGASLGAAEALTNLGATYRVLGQMSESFNCLHRALEISEAQASIKAKAHGLNYLGVSLYAGGDTQAAITALGQAVGLYEELDSAHGKGHALSYLGVAQLLAGNHTEASEHLLQARTIFEQLGDRRGIADTLRDLAALNLATGQPEECAGMASAAIMIYDDISDPLGAAESSVLIARAIAERQPEEALGLLAQALAVSDSIGAPAPAARALLGIAGISQAPLSQRIAAAERAFALCESWNAGMAERARQLIERLRPPQA
jgi:tetratricopeptide (TPR) repeat protein